MTPEDRQRLQELAKHGARWRHEGGIMYSAQKPFEKGHVDDGMLGLGFETCPHPDCVLVRTGGVETLPATMHRCSGCGLRWDDRLNGAELCGDCWRKAQAVVHWGAVETPAQEPLPTASAFIKRVMDRQWESCTGNTEGLPHGGGPRPSSLLCKECVREAFEALRSATSSPPPAMPQETIHLDAGKEVVCQFDSDELSFSDQPEQVTCLECLRIAARAFLENIQDDGAVPPPATEPQTWQPIETAPKRNIAVLVYTPFGNQRFAVADSRDGVSWWTIPGRYCIQPKLWQPISALPSAPHWADTPQD